MRVLMSYRNTDIKHYNNDVLYQCEYQQESNLVQFLNQHETTNARSRLRDVYVFLDGYFFKLGDHGQSQS